MSETPLSPAAQLWSASYLADSYVITKTLHQLGITQEVDVCATGGHDSVLPPGHTVIRPSLASEDGVALFWQGDVPHLRSLYAHQEPIEGLLSALENLLRQGAILPNDCELFAQEEEYGIFPYKDGDQKAYSINARYKRVG